MKKYIILAFKNYGVFYCQEIKLETGEIMLVGKFENKGVEYKFYKHTKDIEIFNLPGPTTTREQRRQIRLDKAARRYAKAVRQGRKTVRYY